MKLFVKSTSIMLVVLFALMTSIRGEIPQLINYQGKITGSGGEALDTTLSITFSIYADSVGGAPLWSENHNSVTITDGLFSVLLGLAGSKGLIGDSLFDGSERWLSILIAGDTEISPRTRLVSAPYSFRAAKVDGISMTGNPEGETGTVDGNSSVILGGRKNIIDGDYSAIISGDSNTVIGDGSVVLGGQGNFVNPINFSDSIYDTSYTVHPDFNITHDRTYDSRQDYNTGLGGGTDCGASGVGAAVVWGYKNYAMGQYDAIVCGKNNHTWSGYSFVGGGLGNYAMGRYSAIVAGHENEIDYATGCFIGTGWKNRIEWKGYSSFIGGGVENIIDSCNSFIGGGAGNHCVARYSTIGGGTINRTEGLCATIAGGGMASFWDVSTGNTVYDNYGYIGGGGDNKAGTDDMVPSSAPFATISGGRGNRAEAAYSAIGGGLSNYTLNSYATVGGGGWNYAEASYSVVAGGDSNQAMGEYSAITGGLANLINGPRSSFIGGGDTNQISGTADYSFIGGGYVNIIGGYCGTISGGGNNYISSSNSTISGGKDNTASGDSATIAGGCGNSAGGEGATIGGGLSNTADFIYATVSGGKNNIAGANGATAGGGYGNEAGGLRSTIAGGYNNEATYDFATVGGGQGNRALHYNSTISGGADNTARGNCAIVPGGQNNSALGSWSLAAGYFAYTEHDGTFVWCDHSYTAFPSTAENQFLVRASNGVGINVNDPTQDIDVKNTIRLRNMPAATGTPVMAAADGTLRIQTSSRRYKRDIKPLDVNIDNVLKLQPVGFKWKSTGDYDIGLCAEDVAAILPDLVICDAEGKPNAVKYDRVCVYLLEVIKNQNEIIGDLNKDIKDARNTSQKQIDGLKLKLNEIESQIGIKYSQK